METSSFLRLELSDIVPIISEVGSPSTYSPSERYPPRYRSLFSGVREKEVEIGVRCGERTFWSNVMHMFERRRRRRGRGREGGWNGRLYRDIERSWASFVSLLFINSAYILLSTTCIIYSCVFLI